MALVLQYYYVITLLQKDDIASCDLFSKLINNVKLILLTC